MNLSQAATNAFGVLRSPNPYTVRPDSRSRAARRVKSLSLETRQNPSNRPEYSRSMASITIAESVAFFPVVYANCCTGWIDWASNQSFHPFRLAPVQSPYARLTCAVPYLATSASRSSMIAGWALSASISTASLAAFSLNHRLLPPAPRPSYHARLTKCPDGSNCAITLCRPAATASTWAALGVVDVYLCVLEDAVVACFVFIEPGPAGSSPFPYKPLFRSCPM